MSHTPGPWIINPRQVDSSPYQILDKDDHEIAATIYGPTGGIEEAKANARLIAAAPELLAILKRLREQNYQIKTADVEDVDRALSHAEGRA